jgi:hypothetical protein
VIDRTWKAFVVVPTAVYLLLFAGSLVLIPGFATRPVGDLGDADCYVVMGFGLRTASDGQLRAGESNRAMARFLLDTNEAGKPAIVQYGVLLGLQELRQEEPKYAGRDVGWARALPHDDKVHVDTWAAAQQSLAVMHDRGLSRPALIAHQDQLKRVTFILRHLRPTGPYVVPEMPLVPYDRRSDQFWTRARWLYRPFELLVSRPRSVLEVFLF